MTSREVLKKTRVLSMAGNHDQALIQVFINTGVAGAPSLKTVE